MKKQKIRIMCITIVSLLAILLVAMVVIYRPVFGRLPRGKRLERIEKSPNYKEGQFTNLSPTQQITSNGSKAGAMLAFLFRQVDGLRPVVDIPTVKTDLKQLAKEDEIMLWLGHSSLFIQTHGKRFLVDPTLITASPVSWLNPPFRGAAIYHPDDMPDIDYLMITHDHYDHLDYPTVKSLRNRVGTVICPLGVGEHFEYWGFDRKQIVELDWDENIVVDHSITIHSLPARHFSGRGLSPNRSLWASYMLQTSKQNIYISGDGGYDTHFAEIKKQFPVIDIAILENGQYNEDWKLIHLMPADLLSAAKDLNPKRLITVHHSKYALAKHPWYKPLENISKFAERDSLNLLTPMIGQPISLNDEAQTFSKWWLTSSTK